MTAYIIKIFTIGFLSFFLAFLAAPTLIGILYKNKLWKKACRDKAADGGDLSVFRSLHAEREVSTPRCGGLLIWLIPLTLALFLLLFPEGPLSRLSFLSREQTWLPFFALIIASLIGLIDDLMQVKPKGTGLSFRYRFLIMSLIGLIGGYWFYYKLGISSVFLPGIGDISIGLFYIPLFIMVTVATYSGAIIDGLDGLSGGTFASIFTGYGFIALHQGQVNLATFCFAIVGSILAFLWFNIPPARFYMGETGIMGLCASLAVVAFATNSVAVLPIIGLLLVIESGSAIIQLLSKKFRKKKIFLSAPIHHHFEAKGWPSYKIVMRFWIVGVVAAIIGVVIRIFPVIDTWLEKF
jgi:phospho-N-acetylmuramoyl-pentapeptide-transferase